VEAQPAGEQAVAVGVVQQVARPAAGGEDRARHDVRPHVEVGLRVADDGGLAGGAAGGVQAGDPLARHGEQAEGIGLAQVLLGGVREFRQIGQGLQVVRMRPGALELAADGLDVPVGVRQRPAQALELQGREFPAAGRLDRLPGFLRCFFVSDRKSVV